MLKVMHRQSYSDSDVSSKKMESWYISWGSGIKTCLHLDKGPPCKGGKVCGERIESEIAPMWEGCSPSLLTLFYFLHLPCDVKSRKICHLLWVRVLSCCGSGPQQVCDGGRDVNPVQRKHSTRPWRSRSPFLQTSSCNQSEGETWNLGFFRQSSAFIVGQWGIPQKEQFPSDGPTSYRLPRAMMRFIRT